MKVTVQCRQKYIISIVLGIWYVDFAGKLQLLLTSSFMTIVLITCYNDFFLILVNQLKEGTQRRQNVCQYNNVSTQS